MPRPAVACGASSGAGCPQERRTTVRGSTNRGGLCSAMDRYGGCGGRLSNRIDRDWGIQIPMTNRRGYSQYSSWVLVCPSRRSHAVRHRVPAVSRSAARRFAGLATERGAESRRALFGYGPVRNFLSETLFPFFSVNSDFLGASVVPPTRGGFFVPKPGWSERCGGRGRSDSIRVCQTISKRRVRR